MCSALVSAHGLKNEIYYNESCDALMLKHETLFKNIKKGLNFPI